MMSKDTKVIISEEISLNSIERLRIDPLSELSEPPVYCRIGGCPSITAGNFSLINGKAKSGKTFFLGSVVASFISNSTQLGEITGTLPPDNRTVLYFDTEQSTFHCSRTIKRICTLSGNPNPDNLIAYGLRPLTPAERVTAIEDKCEEMKDTLGVVIIDGVRDLLTMGINDEQEATSLTSKFLKWTADYNMHLVLLLHQNKTDLNARGHIGTEILNKAETTMTITKDQKTNIFVVSCEYSRDIGFEDFGFIIEDGLPKAADLPQEGQVKGSNPQRINDSEHLENLNEIFKENRKMNGDELQSAIRNHFGVGVIKSRDFVFHYLGKNWIAKERDGKNIYYVYQRAIF